MVISMNTKEREKARTADTMPFDRAVNIPLAKILKPIKSSARVQMRFPVTARSCTGLSGRAKTDTRGFVAAKEAVAVTREITAIIFQTDRDELFQFFMVLFSVTVAEHGRHAIGIAGIERTCEHQDIHDNGHGSDAVFTDIVQHCPVEHHRNNACNQRRCHFGAAVCRGIYKHFEPEGRFRKMKQVLLLAEYEQAGNGRYGVAKTCGNGCAFDSHMKERDEKIIENHIQDAARNGAYERKARFFRSNHIEREIVHKQNGDGKQQITAEIPGTVTGNFPGKPHISKNIFHDQIAEQAHNKADSHIDDYQESEIFSGFFRFLFSHFFHNDRAAAGSEHGRNCGYQLDYRSGQVDGRKRVRTNQV